MSWSSGKDSAYALYLLKKDPNIELLGLFTTVNSEFERVAMHATRINLLQQQAKQIGLPLHIIEIPSSCSNIEYERIMAKFISKITVKKINALAFGDLYLEDIRDYRIKQMNGTDIEAIFPCWGIDTQVLAQMIIDIGIKAKIICVDPRQLSSEFAGRDYDQNFLNSLPKSVDFCGENGEFHSFVYDSPDFKNSIKIISGKIVQRAGFVFADFL